MATWMKMLALVSCLPAAWLSNRSSLRCHHCHPEALQQQQQQQQQHANELKMLIALLHGRDPYSLLGNSRSSDCLQHVFNKVLPLLLCCAGWDVAAASDSNRDWKNSCG
jgi:hypothetical protein